MSKRSDMGGDAPGTRVDTTRALKDAAITALLAFGLFLPLVGFQTVTDVRNDLILTTRWPLLFAVVGKWLVPFAIGFVIAYPAIVIVAAGFGRAVKWIDNFGIQILIYVMLGWGLNIVVGLAGLLDLGYVAFYAVGAYSYALLAKTFGLSFWILLPLAGILASFWGVLLGFPVLRLRGDYLAIVTLAFGEIIRIVLI